MKESIDLAYILSFWSGDTPSGSSAGTLHITLELIEIGTLPHPHACQAKTFVLFL
jgi:hypothetical protein